MYSRAEGGAKWPVRAGLPPMVADSGRSLRGSEVFMRISVSPLWRDDDDIARRRNKSRDGEDSTNSLSICVGQLHSSPGRQCVAEPAEVTASHDPSRGPRCPGSGIPFSGQRPYQGTAPGQSRCPDRYPRWLIRCVTTSPHGTDGARRLPGAARARKLPCALSTAASGISVAPHKTIFPVEAHHEAA